MAATVNLTDPPFVRGEDILLTVTVTDLGNITGFAFEFNLTQSLGGAIAVTKTVGAGITITNGAASIFTVAILDTDTEPLTAPVCFYDIWRTDAGNEVCIAEGEMWFKPTARNA